MSTIVAGITASVDGYITGPDDRPGCGLDEAIERARGQGGQAAVVRRGPGGLVLVAGRGRADQQRSALPALRPDPARGWPVISAPGQRLHHERIW